MFRDLKLVILDRDGVINYDSAEYIKSAEEWIPLPGSLEAIAQLNKAKILVGVATNQSGIGRGFYNIDTLAAMHEKMGTMLAYFQGKVDAIRYCPHTPEENCLCRKPQSAMIQSLVEHFKVSAQQTLVVGDAWRDIQAGRAIGCHTALVLTGKGQDTFSQHGHELQETLCVENLSHLVQKIL